MSSKHSSRLPHPLPKLRPTTIRRIVTLTVFLYAVGLAVVESLTPHSGHIRVVISAKSIATGASVAEQDVAFKDIPRDLVPSGAVADIAAVRERILATGILSGEIFTEQQMVSPSLTKLLAGMSESKIIAITLTDSGIASALRTGDSVDIVLTADECGMATPIAHGARVVNIVDDEVVLIALPIGTVEVVAATSLASPLTLLLAGERPKSHTLSNSTPLTRGNSKKLTCPIVSYMATMVSQLKTTIRALPNAALPRFQIV